MKSQAASLDKTKKTETHKDKALSSSDNSKTQKAPEKSPSISKHDKKATEKSPSVSTHDTKTVKSAKKSPSHRDSIVFSRLETIAHNILRVLKHREMTSEGPKLRYKINRNDLLKIRDFIKATRNPAIERKVKVRSAKEALGAIKNLLKLIKSNKLGKVKTVEDNKNIGKALDAVKTIHSDAFSKSKVPTDKKNSQQDRDNSSTTKAPKKEEQKSESKHNKNYYLKKLKALRVKLLKDKLLKVLKIRGNNLNTDLKTLKSKLEKQVKQEKREKRDEEQDTKREMQEKPGNHENLKKPLQKKERGLKDKKSVKSTKRFHRISKELRNIIQKKLKKLNIIMNKEESGDVQRGTKRFLLDHGRNSFRKNLISLGNLDANKMTDDDLKKLHDKLNEWIEVEEKLERETENGEAKDEITSGVTQANDLLSSLQLQDVNGKSLYENKDNVVNYQLGGNDKKNRKIEIDIDVNKQGGNNPNVNIAQENNQMNDAATNFESTNGYNQASNMYKGNRNPARINPSDTKYLKELATAYMDGKAIRENKHFGENMKKFEENYEKKVNNFENNNNNNNRNNNRNNNINNNINNRNNNNNNINNYNKDFTQSEGSNLRNKNLGTGNQNGFNPSKNNVKNVPALDKGNAYQSKGKVQQRKHDPKQCLHAV